MSWRRWRKRGSTDCWMDMRLDKFLRSSTPRGGKDSDDAASCSNSGPPRIMDEKMLQSLSRREYSSTSRSAERMDTKGDEAWR